MVEKMYFKVSKFAKYDVELIVTLTCWAPQGGAARLCKCMRLHNWKEPWHGYGIPANRVITPISLVSQVKEIKQKQKRGSAQSCTLCCHSDGRDSTGNRGGDRNIFLMCAKSSVNLVQR